MLDAWRNQGSQPAARRGNRIERRGRGRSHFIAMIAHDIRTAAIIKGAVGLCRTLDVDYP